MKNFEHIINKLANLLTSILIVSFTSYNASHVSLFQIFPVYGTQTAIGAPFVPTLVSRTHLTRASYWGSLCSNTGVEDTPCKGHKARSLQQTLTTAEEKRMGISEERCPYLVSFSIHLTCCQAPKMATLSIEDAI